MRDPVWWVRIVRKIIFGHLFLECPYVRNTPRRPFAEILDCKAMLAALFRSNYTPNPAHACRIVVFWRLFGVVFWALSLPCFAFGVQVCFFFSWEALIYALSRTARELIRNLWEGLGTGLTNGRFRV